MINPALIALSPNSQALLTAGIFPKPNVTGTDSFTGGAKAPTSVKEEIVRIDHTFNDHWAIFGNWISEQVLQTDIPTRWDNTNDPTDSDTFGNPSYQAVVHLTDTISPTLLNEIAFNYDGNRINMLPAGISALSGTNYKFAQNKLFPGSPTNILPFVGLSGQTGLRFGNNWNPWVNTADGYQIRDDVSWTKGAHQVKFGFDWFKFDKLQPLQTSIAGSFNFNGGFTGYDFADYLLGLSSSYSEAALEDKRQWNSVSWGAYIEDDWRATKRLTLNLGLRWEGDPHTAEVNNQMAAFYPGLFNSAGVAAAVANNSMFVPGTNGNPIICGPANVGSNPLTQCSAANPFLGTGPNPALNGLLQYNNGLAVAGQTAGVTGGLVPNYWDTFGPRIGFAFDLTGQGKTVIRAGFGTFFERIQGNDMYQESSNLFGGNASVNNVSFNDPHSIVGAGGGAISTASLPVTVSGLTTLNSLNYKTPTSYQYSIGLQQQFGRQTVLSVAYVGNQGRHESEQSGINSVPLSVVPSLFSGTSVSNTTNANLFRPYLGYGGVTMDSNDARSRYNSVQVSLRSQFRDLTLQGAYTYSHAFDPTSNSEDGGDLSSESNPYAGWLYDYGPAFANRNSILLIDVVYNLQASKTRGPS